MIVATLLILSVNNQYLERFQKLYTIFFARNAEDRKIEKGFAANFTITLGTHRSGADLLAALIEKKYRTSVWSAQALENPDFPVVGSGKNG